jgi:hypothetical protein
MHGTCFAGDCAAELEGLADVYAGMLADAQVGGEGTAAEAAGVV